MSISFADVTDISIPQGSVTKITETSSGRVLWDKYMSYMNTGEYYRGILKYQNSDGNISYAHYMYVWEDSDTVRNNIQLDGLSMLQHFDYPETWSYNGNAEFSDSSKFGNGCAYFPDAASSVSVTNTTGMFNLHPEANYEFEAFVKSKDMITELEAQGYYFYGGHTFKYFDTAVTWAEAKTACETRSGHLATSTSEEKNTFLTTITTETLWLGATDEVTEGVWKWVTGEAWSYTKWASGEPNNSDGSDGVEHYLLMGHQSIGTWNDVTLTSSFGYICEWDYDIRYVPEQYSTLGLTSADWYIDVATTTELTPNV